MTHNGGDGADLMADLAEHFWQQRRDKIDRAYRETLGAWGSYFGMRAPLADSWEARIWATKQVDG